MLGTFGRPHPAAGRRHSQRSEVQTRLSCRDTRWRDTWRRWIRLWSVS